MESPRNQNSLVQAQVLELATGLFLDFALHHPHLKISLNRDLEAFRRRLLHEGVSFATQTLPQLGKAVYRSFETGVFRAPLGFRTQKGTTLPRFLGGLLTCVYDADGSLKPGFAIELTDIIQICFAFYKLDLPYSSSKNEKVIEAFCKTEEDLSQLQIADTDVILDAQDLASKVLQGFNAKEIKPKHGPGGVATRERLGRKWEFARKYENIHRVYPYYEYFVPSRRSLLDRISWYRNLETLESGTARVCLVPKDSRGPRLISMEPLEYQFIQQGIKDALVKRLEEKSPYTRGYVNFADQSVNRNLARWNSVTRRYATLDMKEASDRVSVALVTKVFEKTPEFLNAILATRTTHTELPDGRVLKLHKFAPMGSALCFPVEALVFWLLAKVIMRRESIKGRVYVYGDDIVVPRELVPFLFKEFPQYGLKFNEDKCFVTGYFRESCGMDAYKGNICTPIRMRKLVPSSRKHAASLVSAVEFSNALWKRGYWNSATMVQNRIDSVLSIGSICSPRDTFGGLSYTSFTSKGVTIGRARVRYNKDYQRHEALVPTFVQKVKCNAYTGEGQLFANLIQQVQKTAPVPQAGSIKLEWKLMCA